MNTNPISNTIITQTAAQLIAAVAEARDKRVPMIDYGIAHAGLGYAPPLVYTSLRQQADPSNGGILEHYTRDLTVRAAAGITISALQAALKPTNQFVPVDADDDITLGEAIDHNTWGPLRAGYGSLRDLLLGLHYIDGEARDIHVGGRTVKNVAGYDVTRFMVGSLGELGMVHEATLRTHAIPEHVLSVELSMIDPSVLDERGTDLLLSDAKPTHLSYCYRCGRAGASEGTWSAQIAYFGKHSGCLVQLRSLVTFLDSLPGVHVVGNSDVTLESDTAERMVRRAWRRTASAVVKIIVPPAATGQICKALADWSCVHQQLHIDALPLHGCIFTGGPLDGAAALSLDRLITDAVAAAGGLRIWYARPAQSDTAIDPFGSPQPDHAMLLKLKQTMDPHNVFNPGRFLR